MRPGANPNETCRSPLPNELVGLGAALLAVAVFLVDAFAARGATVAIAHLIVLLVAHRTGRRDWVFIGAAICSLLTFAALAGPSWSEVSLADVIDRGLVVGVLWLTASLSSGILTRHRRREEEQSRLQAVLEAGLTGTWFWDISANLLQVDANIFAVLLDVDGVVSAANRFSLEACGYSADAAVGRLFWDAEWWSASDEVKQGIRDATLRAGEGIPYRGEHRYFLADGSARVIDIALYPIHHDGDKPLFIHATGTDVTARRASEEALRRHSETFTRLVDRSPFGLYVVDSEFRISRVSDGAKLAFRNVRPLIGRDFEEAIHILWPTEVAQDIVSKFRHTLDSGEPYLAPSLTEHRSDLDVTESYEWQIYRVALPDGKHGVVCYFFDSTELREAERALRESEQEARLANRAKSEFLANMSHEIRTPMAAILGHVDVLQAQLVNPENRASVATIKRNGQHLLAIINDILDLSRIEAGKLDAEIAACNLTALLADVESLMRVRIDSDDVDFEVTTRGRLPETIATDEKRLRQILLNLIGNAIKFTREGRVAVAVELVDSGDEPRIRFEVADTGIGIAEDQLASLFRPFVQADASITRDFGGSGLGLVICERMTELLRGDLHVESTLGEGSKFSVTVPTGPLEGVALIDVRSAAHSPDDDVSLPSHRLSCHVLLVDDSHDVCEATRHFLERAGATVTVMGNGSLALAAVDDATTRDEPFDAIIMDMQMPTLDGYTAVSALRAAGHEMPIIALTAAAMPGDRQRCLDVGCDEYLSKPVQHAELVAMLHQFTADDDATPTRREAPDGERTETTSRRQVSVLVVDDHTDTADSTAILLGMSGFSTSVAHDGASALERVARHPPEVVLLDIGLPDLDGHAVARRLRADGFSGLLIALSGRDLEGEMERSMECGFDHHVIKPADLGDLVRLIRSSHP